MCCRVLLKFFAFFFMALAVRAEITIAISSTPNNLSPFHSTDANSQNINRLVYSSLVQLNNKMEYVCDLCESYKEEFKDNKHIINFKLKKNIYFSDGSELSGEDVVNSWKFFTRDSAINSEHKDTFELLENVEKIDNDLVRLTYKNFSLENIGNLAMLKIVKINKKNYENLQVKDILGSGQYIIQDVTPLNVSLKSKTIDKENLVFKVVKDETTLALKLINKEIDLSVASISPRKNNWLKKNASGLIFYETPSSNYIFLGMNQKSEVFKDLRIRKAISYLIPKVDLLKYKLKGTVISSTSMFSPAFEKMYENNKEYIYDPKEAQRLIEEAGYKKNKFGFYEKNNKEFRIDWKVSNNKSSIENADLIKEYFEKSGIKVALTVLEWSTYMSNFKAGNFDVVVGQWIGFNGPDMLRFVFHSENIPPKGGNRIRYANKEFDRIIDLATKEIDPNKRITLYKQANKIVTDEMPYISLWHPNVIWIASDCLKNIELEPTGSFAALPKVEKNCGHKK